jgi:hopanoid biosynthesis associated RND transporter like protein HpnN
MEHEELDSVVRSASLAGVLALVMVVAVLYWALRSIRLLVASVFALLVGLIATAALAGVLVGHLNLLSVAFAVLYIGLGVDFILHICLRVKEGLGQGKDIDAAIAWTMRSIGASLVICTLTTAAGFYAFVPSRLFEGISELGLISGSGMFVSLIVSVTVLPATLAMIYRTRHHNVRANAGLQVTSFAIRHARVVVISISVVVLLAAISLPRVYFDSNPVNLRDPNAESVVTLSELARDSDAAMLTMVGLFDASADVAMWADRFSALPEVREVRSVETLVPQDQDEKLLLLDDLAFVLGPGFADVSYSASRRVELVAAAEQLLGVLPDRDTASATQLRLRAAAERFASQQPDGGAEQSSADQAAALDRALLGNLPEQLARLDLAMRAQPFGLDDLPMQLSERWVAEDGTQLLEIVPRDNIRENAAAAQFVSAVRGVMAEATGLPVVYDEAARVIVTSFRQALTYAVVAIAIILIVFLRSIRDCMIVLIPIFCAAVLTAGSTVWIGIPFNFANIIALPLLVGVGVDNAIHMLHRLHNDSGTDDTAGSTSLAVFASGLTTIASFGNLAFSTHRGMATMGTLLTIGMIVMMVMTLVFLPALLRLRVR